jgi:hypothetical protein
MKKQEFGYPKLDGVWTMILTSDQDLKVSFASRSQGIKETREYEIGEQIVFAEQKKDYVFLHTENGNFFQFKFEDGGFLVGDIYDKEGNFIEEYAAYVFCE